MVVSLVPKLSMVGCTLLMSVDGAAAVLFMTHAGVDRCAIRTGAMSALTTSIQMDRHEISRVPCKAPKPDFERILKG